MTTINRYDLGDNAVRDPVCGRGLTEDEAVASEIVGASQRLFCSHRCKAHFRAERSRRPGF